MKKTVLALMLVKAFAPAFIALFLTIGVLVYGYKIIPINYEAVAVYAVMYAVVFWWTAYSMKRIDKEIIEEAK